MTSTTRAAVPSALHSVEDETRELFAGRHELAVGELRYVEIDVAVIEPLAHFGREHTIEHAEIDDHSGRGIDLAGDGDVADVAVAVITLARAQPEDALVSFFRPVGTPVAMRRGERDAAREKGRHRAESEVVRSAEAAPFAQDDRHFTSIFAGRVAVSRLENPSGVGDSGGIHAVPSAIACRTSVVP